MLMEVARLLLGLTIALFHEQVADFLRKRDGALAATFREHGVPVPGGLPKRASHDLFFLFGIVIALVSLTRIWLTLR
jgi:hypothetical protein